MKKIFIFSFFVCFMLSGCKINSVFENAETRSNSDNFSGQTNSIFDKNQECLKYKNEIEKKLSQKTVFGDTSLQEIFYSPKQNSCLYVEYSNTAGDSNDEYLFNKRLFDIRNDSENSKPIEACIGARTKLDCEEFDEMLNDYK